MDVSLSAKSQTLSLISCFSLPSSSSPSSFSRSCSVQREFLGSGHRLRPPGLTSRRRSNKLGFENRRHRFLLRASLLSRPLVVIVAVAAAFSAFTVVYLNYVRRRKDARELSGSKDLTSLQDLELSKQWRGLLMQHIEKQILDCGEINEEIPVIARKSEIEKTNDNDMPAEKRDVQNQRTALIHEETLVSGTLELCGSTKEDESEGLNLTSSVVADEFTLPEPIDFTIKMPEFLPETSPVKAVLLSELPGEVIELESSASSVSLRLETIETSEGNKPRHEVGKGIEFPYSGQKFLLKASSREELYTFYEENKSGTRTMLSLSNLKPTSPGSLQHSTRLSPLLSPNILKGMELATQGSFHTSGNLEGQIPLACYREGSYIKAKEMGKGWEFPQDVRKRLPPQNIPSNRVKSPQPNGKCTTNKHDSSEYLRTYNCLLRDGRLPDCIELLESMEQRGLLDMDKIYHAKFFNTCKSQKAVKEAFHFINLIGNPALSTFNMLLSVCSSAQDSEGAFKVLQLVKEAGLKADCKLYTNLISTCAKSGKVDPMFEVFHEMVNAAVEPNLHTYGALIDGCARAGQVAKAFGAYGILRSKKVKPDRVVFNALITACGQSGAVDRAFDVLAEMKAEPTPVDPDHVTVGALIKTCAQAGEFDRAREVYKMIHQYNIKGTPEVYTIAVNSCSQTGDLDFALKVYEDMARNGVVPDEMFVSALMDVAGHAGKIDVAFKVLQEARIRGTRLGNVAYSSLMGACSNAENWQKALEVYEDIKAIKLQPTTSTLNALVTALCNGDQLGKAVEVLTEMKKVGVCPNSVTYTILSVASEKKDELETGLMLYSQAKKDGVVPYNITCKCLISMCLRRFEKAYSLGEQIITFNSGKTQIDNKWTSLALTIYREAIIARVVPSMKVLSLVLGCLQFPHDTSLRARFIENLGVFSDVTRYSNMYSLLNGFGEYDPRSFSLLEEAASLGIVPCVSFKGSPIVVDARKFQIHAAEVYLITVLKGLKHQLAADASVKLPNLTVLLPVEKTQIQTPKGEKTIKLAGRVAQAVGALLRRLGLPYQGNESYGKIRITGLAMKRWFQPKFASPFIGSNPSQLNSLPMRLAKGILDQQRNIRTSNLSLD